MSRLHRWLFGVSLPVVLTMSGGGCEALLGLGSDDDEPDPPPVTASEARAALDGLGYGLVAYVKDTDAHLGDGEIWTRDYSGPATGFSGPDEPFVCGPAAFDLRVTHDPFDGTRILFLGHNGVNDPNDENHGSVYATRKPDGGDWYREVPLDAGPTTRGSLGLVSDGFGRAAAVWETEGAILFSLAPNGGDFLPPVVLFADALLRAQTPRIVATAAGIIAVTYVAEVGGDAGVLLQIGDFVHGMEPPVRLDAAASCRAPALAATFDGFLLVWQQLLADGTGSVVSRPLSFITGPGAELQLAPLAVLSEQTRVVVDVGQTATAAWVDGATRRIHASRMPQGGAWDPPTDLGAVVATSTPPSESFDLEVDGLGRVTVAALTPIAIGVRWTAADGWLAPHELNYLSEAARSVDVAADASGMSIVACVLLDQIVQPGVSTGAWTDPDCEMSWNPPAPLTGDNVFFSSSGSFATSPNGGPSTFEWDFDGDGVVDSTASGLVHSFTVPGAFPITLTVTDAWGHSTSTTKTVTVVSSGGPPWRLFVVKAGAGSGYVSSDLDSDGDGTPDIDFGSDNEEFYADGPAPDDHAQVFLTPVADPGSVFSHWEGLSPPIYFDGDYGAGGCLVQMVAHRTITAVFH